MERILGVQVRAMLDEVQGIITLHLILYQA